MQKFSMAIEVLTVSLYMYVHNREMASYELSYSSHMKRNYSSTEQNYNFHSAGLEVERKPGSQ